MHISLSEEYPTVGEIETWGENELLDWLQMNLKPPLSSEDEGKIRTAQIDGCAFLIGAGDRSLFVEAGLALGSSARLAQLAKDIVDRKGKCYGSYHMSCRQLTMPIGDREQPELKGRPLESKLETILLEQARKANDEISRMLEELKHHVDKMTEDGKLAKDAFDKCKCYSSYHTFHADS
jgi:hypothetical protein